MYCGRCGKKIEGTAGICYYCQTRYTITAANLPCPSCAALRARIEVLEKAVEWARDRFYWKQDREGETTMQNVLNRRAKEG
jgi:hypothetical protein